MTGRPDTPSDPAAAPPPDVETPYRRLMDLSERLPAIRRLAMALIDSLILTCALAMAYQIGFLIQPDRFTGEYHRQFLHVVPVLVALRILLLWALGLYRGFTRYTGTHELINILLAGLAGSAALALFNLANTAIPSLGPWYPLHPSDAFVLRVPWGVVIIDALLAVNGLAAIRVGRRILGERLVELRAEGRRRVLVVGAGDEGEQVVSNLLKHAREHYRPVAFVDPNPRLVGRRIHGLPVAGTLDTIEPVCRRYGVQVVVIALPEASPRLLRELVDRTGEQRLEFRIVPELKDLMAGRIEFNQLRRVEIEDLLGRPPVVLGADADRSYLQGRRLLVTGAGGSIGSEICRQVLAQRPARLALLGRGENSLYDINQELAERAKAMDVELELIVGNVRDPFIVEGVFDRLRPEVVLHAAAHKHVHFMEAQPAEAIKNNVLGTRLVAEAALRVGVERFIMISTDKAVRPTGVMGASKRVAELICSALNQEGATRFISVRFGNVMGSRGSVIPLFKRQIAQGGPVTITHPDVTRYFMTIPEAVSLVLEAGSVGQGGEVFLLDMGDPVRIVDMARQLIKLSGLEPERDIAITFTGMRPGEKLHEELLTSEEFRQKTSHEKIYCCPQSRPGWTGLQPQLDRLIALALTPQPDPAAIKQQLAALIPDYRGWTPADPQSPRGASL